MLDFFERLVTKSRVATEKKKLTWLQLIIDVCDGNEPSEDDVLSALQRLGKTVEELQSSVQLLKRRRELNELVKGAELAQTQITEAEAELIPAAEEFKAAEARFLKVHQDIRERIDQLRRLVHTGGDARRELASTATDPSIQQIIDRCGKRIGELQNMIDRSCPVRFQTEKELQRLEAGVGKPDEYGRVIDTSSHIASTRQRVIELAQQEAKNRSEMAALQSEVAEAEIRKLIPESIA